MKANTKSGPVLSENLYFRDLRKHKLLDREREWLLARRFQTQNDQKALHQLIRGNLRLVVKIAKGFWTDNHVSFKDLIQEGNIGLVQAARKFDPHRKVKFSSYASFWIKAYIHKYLMNNYRSVRVVTTQSQRKWFYHFKKLEAQMVQEGIAPTPSNIAERLDIPEKEVVEMQKRLQRRDVSLNAPLPNRKNEERINKVVSESMSAEDLFEKDQLRKMVWENARQFQKQLDAREKEIFQRRIISEQPETLETLGNTFNISRERVRQVEGRIIQKLRDYLIEKLPDIEAYFYN
jgi:RNA polymerase sigma-32 factor